MLMASLHSTGQDDRNEVQHDFSGHVMPLALELASHNAVSILNVTITFLRSRQSKLEFLVMWHDYHWHWHHMMPLVLVSHDALGSVLVSDDANSIINGITVFLRQRQLKWCVTHLFGHMTPLTPASHNANNIINGIIAFLRPDATWLFGHVMPMTLTLVSHDDNCVISGTTAFLRSRQSNWDAA